MPNPFPAYLFSGVLAIASFIAVLVAEDEETQRSEYWCAMSGEHQLQILLLVFILNPIFWLVWAGSTLASKFSGSRNDA